MPSEKRLVAGCILRYVRTMRSLDPHPALRTRGLAIDVVESVGGESLVLPSTSAVLGFQFRGRVRTADYALSTAGVTGLQNSANVLVRRGYWFGAGAVYPAGTVLGEAREPLGTSAIARALDMRERQFERRFVARVGLMPKRTSWAARRLPIPRGTSGSAIRRVGGIACDSVREQ